MKRTAKWDSCGLIVKGEGGYFEQVIELVNTMMINLEPDEKITIEYYHDDENHVLIKVTERDE